MTRLAWRTEVVVRYDWRRKCILRMVRKLCWKSCNGVVEIAMFLQYSRGFDRKICRIGLCIGDARSAAQKSWTTGTGAGTYDNKEFEATLQGCIVASYCTPVKGKVCFSIYSTLSSGLLVESTTITTWSAGRHGFSNLLLKTTR